NSFTAYGKFDTDMGEIISDVQLNNVTNAQTAYYSGDIQLLKYNLGSSLGTAPWVKKLDLNAKIKGKTFDPDKLELTIFGTARNVEVDNYTFKEVALDGKYEKKAFKGAFVI